VSLLEELETRKNHPPDPVLPEPVKAPVEEPARAAKSTIPVFSGNQETSSGLLQQLYIQIEWLNSFEPVSPFEFETRDQAGYTVGSSEDCDFYLPHPGVQPLHFSLLVHADHVEIWD